jgi:formate dehydrogenase
MQFFLKNWFISDLCILIATFVPFQVPELLGTTENELGIRKWLEDQGHTLVTTSDKEGENSTFDKELVDAEIIITTPYAP